MGTCDRVVVGLSQDPSRFERPGVSSGLHQDHPHDPAPPGDPTGGLPKEVWRHTDPTPSRTRPLFLLDTRPGPVLGQTPGGTRKLQGPRGWDSGPIPSPDHFGVSPKNASFRVQGLSPSTLSLHPPYPSPPLLSSDTTPLPAPSPRPVPPPSRHLSFSSCLLLSRHQLPVPTPPPLQYLPFYTSPRSGTSLVPHLCRPDTIPTSPYLLPSGHQSPYPHLLLVPFLPRPDTTPLPVPLPVPCLPSRYLPPFTTHPTPPGGSR